MFRDYYQQAQTSDHQAAKVFRYVVSTPPWVYSISLTLGGLLLIVPVLILIFAVIAALVMMVATFYILNFAHQIFIAIRSALGGPDEEGRQNVKVVHREE